MSDTPAAAVAYAIDIRKTADDINVSVRSGLHLGVVENVEDGDIGGIVLHVGARVAAAANAGQVVISRTVDDLLTGSSVEVTDHGFHERRGLEGSWQLFEVGAADHAHGDPRRDLWRGHELVRQQR